MDIVTQVILPLVLAFIMFSMGLSLVVDDFKRVVKFPKAFLVGAFLQIICLPLIAFFITNIWVNYFNLTPAFAVGMIIIAACPGGVTSNLFTHIGGGDTALSISLTAIISVLSVLTIPFIVNLGYSQFFAADQESPLPIAKTVMGIFCVTTVPVMIGMLLKSKKSQWADRFEPVAKKVASLLFALIIIATLIKKWTVFTETFLTLGPITLFFNLIVMSVAFWVARWFAMKPRQAIAITFECGLQNGTLAIMIALTFLKNEEMMLPGTIYSLLMLISACSYMFLSYATSIAQKL